jgi:hypothetical protein
MKACRAVTLAKIALQSDSSILLMMEAATVTKASDYDAVITRLTAREHSTA